LAFENRLRQGGRLLFVTKVTCSGIQKSLDGVCLARLLLEIDSEDYVLHCLEQLGKPSHVEGHFALVVRRTVHGFKQNLRHLHVMAELILH